VTEGLLDLLVFAFVMSTISQVLVVYMYADNLLGTHAFEMPLERHDLFSLVSLTYYHLSNHPLESEH
jgi:hypothetical protein